MDTVILNYIKFIYSVYEKIAKYRKKHREYKNNKATFNKPGKNKY